jgi:hypothetical protein
VTGQWQRLGRLALDTSAAPWAATHAALPVSEPDGEGGSQIYLSIRDAEGRARIGRARLELTPRPRFDPLEADPVLDIGQLGAFDDSGVTSSCLVEAGGRRYLFYTGWSRGVTVPFYLAAGLAVSDGGGPFRRLSGAPLLERTAVDPFLTASPFVMVENGRWRMWYISATGWSRGADRAKHAYHVRYAESGDGLVWDRRGEVALDYASPGEHAFARPCVIRDADAFRMWFAVRGDRYRIGYAESADGRRWRRMDAAAGLGPGTDPWESEMVAYPWVFDWRGARYMLYNGNDYGRTGVGLAVWVPDRQP